MNGKQHDILYGPFGGDVDSAETAEKPPDFMPSNNGFSHHEPTTLSARTSITRSKCRNVSIAMPRNMKIYDLRLVAKKGPQV